MHLYERQCDRLTLWAAHFVSLPMAQTSQLESRLTAILEAKRRRTMVTHKMLMVALLAATAVLAPLAALQPVVAADSGKEAVPPLRGEVVVIDPGHGANDWGAVATGGVTEKALNLEIAQRLRALLEQRVAVVFLTRDGDTNPNLRERAQFAAEKHAADLISIHCEGETLKGRSGAEVYYHAENPSERRLAQAISLKVSQATGEPGHVLSDTARFTKGFAVLRGASMSAVLVECGFMGSPSDLARLRDPQGQQQIVEGVAQGLAAFQRHS